MPGVARRGGNLDGNGVFANNEGFKGDVINELRWNYGWGPDN